MLQQDFVQIYKNVKDLEEKVGKMKVPMEQEVMGFIIQFFTHSLPFLTGDRVRQTERAIGLHECRVSLLVNQAPVHCPLHADRQAGQGEGW